MIESIRHLELVRPRREDAAGDELYVSLDVGGGFIEHYLVPLGEGRDPKLEELEGIAEGGAYGARGRYQLYRCGRLVLDLERAHATALAAMFQRRRMFRPTKRADRGRR